MQNQPILCKFFMQGHCRRFDGCKFAHPPAYDINNKPCKFFARNACTNGDACNFAHVQNNYNNQYQQQYSQPPHYQQNQHIHSNFYNHNNNSYSNNNNNSHNYNNNSNHRQHRRPTTSAVDLSNTGLFMLVLAGIPGCGKSTFAKALVQQAPNRYFRISQDELGRRQDCEEKARWALTNGKVPVIDRCNFDDQQRAHFLSIASQFQIPVECIVFDDVSAEVCVSRAQQRTGMYICIYIYICVCMYLDIYK